MFSESRVLHVSLSLMLLISIESYSQVIDETIPGIPSKKYRNDYNKYSLSIGYGFPNVDQSFLPSYYGYAKNKVVQNGPITFSLAYNLKNSTSIGLLVTTGKVSANYDATSDSLAIKNLEVKFVNRSTLLSFVRYFPGKQSAITPYTKVALGVNWWEQTYNSIAESGTVQVYNSLPVFAWQGAIGAKIKLYKSVNVYGEVGYGKYIVSAGLITEF